MVSMRGILSWGGYLPYRRLDRTLISAVAGSGGGNGTRTVASYDEDTTTLGVEAARLAGPEHQRREVTTAESRAGAERDERGARAGPHADEHTAAAQNLRGAFHRIRFDAYRGDLVFRRQPATVLQVAIR